LSLRIAIVDDLAQDRARIEQLTVEILSGEKVPHSIQVFADGNRLLESIRSGEKYQVFLLDVMMDTIGGMELADELRRCGNKPQIIFISSNREMAMYGYERNAIRYLGKPVQRDKLEEALLYCVSLWQSKKEILLPTSQGQYRTSFRDIDFVEAFDRGTRFYFRADSVECRMKFGEVENWLPKSSFLMCHRAYIVNLSKVKSIRNYAFTLVDGRTVPIGKNRYNDVYRQFVEYISN
jgi:DNA-binding LytR/AlgR family response regulator